MASIFTFDPDPPSVASPWSKSAQRPSRSGNSESSLFGELVGHDGKAITSSGGVTSLGAEPQSGPIEYKLHLLMRPRKLLAYTSTPRHVSGSRHSKSTPSTPRHDSENSDGSATPFAQVGGSRQHRMEQLTTQLLWRLQQSSPYHTTASDNLILPTLPDADSKLRASHHPAKLLAGLEESRGALYEIGVADDGP